MAKITYEDKQNLTTDPELLRINKVIDDDMNEIKQVVNANDDTLNAVLQPLNKIVLEMSATQEFGSGLNWYYINKLDTIKRQTGTAFTIGTVTPSGSGTSMSGVKIPTGISKVNVSGMLYMQNNNNNSAMYLLGCIYKVSSDGTTATSITASLVADIPAGDYASFAMVPQEIDVEEGDVIGFRIYKETAAGLANVLSNVDRTFLTVEEVR